MNTTKLYLLNESDYVLQLSNGIQYTITSNAVTKSNINVSSLTEVVFDVTLQGNIENAISNSGNIVNSLGELKVIQALIQEKIEDFD